MVVYKELPMIRTLSLSLLLAFLATACMSMDKNTGTGPAAPTELAASALSGGAHLTWKDNSTDETEFMIMRMQEGVDTEMKTVASVPFNGTAYHNTPLTSGSTYMYVVGAMNDKGENDSAMITFVAP